MKPLLLALSLVYVLLHNFGSTSVVRRPQCICTGRVSAIMEDSSGAYCVYYESNQPRQWRCENKDEWDKYLRYLHTGRYPHQPRCQCSGLVSATWEDDQGKPYCIYNYGNGQSRQWDCENKEEWKLYRQRGY